MQPRPTDVLSDLLAVASEDAAERLVETDRLLRKLAGDELVNEAHAVWTDRNRGWVEEYDRPGSCWDVVANPESDVFDLTKRLRASSPARGRRGRP